MSKIYKHAVQNGPGQVLLQLCPTSQKREPTFSQHHSKINQKEQKNDAKSDVVPNRKKHKKDRAVGGKGSGGSAVRPQGDDHTIERTKQGATILIVVLQVLLLFLDNETDKRRYNSKKLKNLDYA